MYNRSLSEKLRSLSEKFPVISIVGPRQSGKTTLARQVFGSHAYVSLEDPEQREAARADPKGFLRRFSGGVIFDEVQRAPDLLSYLQVVVDNEDAPGRFVLTGSQQFLLMSRVGQSLAGRTAVLHLLPLSLDELLGRPARRPNAVAQLPESREKPPFALESLLHRGLYPRIHDKAIEPGDWYSAYYATYVERDVREVATIGNLDAFQRFVRLCAGRCGQILNLSSLGADCGVSHTTARHWISIQGLSISVM